MKKAYCKKCGKEVQPAPWRSDEEKTLIGYLHCPEHPRSDITFTKPKEE